MDKMLYRTHELVEQLGLPRSKVYELMRDGELPFVKVGRHRLVTQAACDAFIARLEAQAASDAA